MMEKRNVATERRVKDEDEKELEKEAALFGGLLLGKKAEARDPKPAEEDEKSDEDTLR